MEPSPRIARSASLRRIPSLDGLRAISISLVLALHTLQHYELTHTVSKWWYVLCNGGVGVYIFFVISGYLITKLLLHERETRGSVSLRGFYLRRAFRILPPLYVYIGVVLLFAAAGRLQARTVDVLSALFFFHNYAPNGSSWAFEHLWTLSLEEQFYLLWPAVFFLCLRGGGQKGRWRAAKVTLLVIALSPLVRVVAFKGLTSPLLHNGLGFHMRADSLMFGCVAALLEGTGVFERVYRSVTRFAWVPPGVILLSSAMEVWFQNYWNMPIGFTVTGAAIAAFLLWCVRNPATAVGRVLNSRVVTHIGVLSYSIYLWQMFFLHSLAGPVFGRFQILREFPISWVAVLVAAEVSFFVVEQPSLRLRNLLLRSFHVYARRVEERRELRAEAQTRLVD